MSSASLGKGRFQVAGLDGAQGSVFETSSQVMPLPLGPGPHFGKIIKRPLLPWNFTCVHPFNGIWKLVAAREVPRSGH